MDRLNRNISSLSSQLSNTSLAKKLSNWFQPDNNDSVKYHYEVIDNYREKRFFDEADFIRDAMIAALKSAKDALSVNLGKTSANHKKEDIQKCIDTLDGLKVADLTLAELSKLNEQYIDLLDDQRSSLFKSDVSRSKKEYCRIMDYAKTWLSNHFYHMCMHDIKYCNTPHLDRIYISSDKLSPADQYNIFESVFIKQIGLAYQTSGTTQYIVDYIIRCLKTAHFEQFTEFNLFNKIFKDVFIQPSGVFVDSTNQWTKDIVARMSSCINIKNYRDIYDKIFIKPKGVLANDTDERTKTIAVALIDFIKNEKIALFRLLSSNLYYDIFISPVGVYATPHNQQSQTMLGLIINTIENFNPIEKYNDLYEEAFNKLYQYIFIHQDGIFADQTDARTIAIADSLINSLKNNYFKNKTIGKICQNIFIRPEGVFADHTHPWTQAMVTAVTHQMKTINLERFNLKEIFDVYTTWSEQPDIMKSLDILFLDMFAANRLQEPEVIKKLAHSVLRGVLKVIELGYGIDLFVKLSTIADEPLLNFISDNTEYFLKQDGIKHFKEILQNELLIKPLSQNSINVRFENKLIRALNKLKEGICTLSVVDDVISSIRRGDINNYINQEVRKKTTILVH